MATPSASVLARLKLLREELATRQPAQEAYKKAMREVPYAEQPTFEQWLALPEQKTYRLPAALVGSAALAGGSVQDPDQMTHKPQPKTANPLAALVRGWAAGTGGLGRDAEDLTRLVAKYFSAPGSIAERYGQSEAVLPSTEFYKDWLPGKSMTEGIGGRELASLGSLAGGVGLGTAAKGVTRVGSAIAHAAPGPLAGGRAAQQGVIKLKGLSGNWLRETAEHALSGLKSPEPPWENTALSDVARILGLSKDELSSQRAWRQGHGTIRTPAGERDLQEALSSINPPRTPDPVNSWVDNQLVEYVKSDMATPTDPVRLAIEAWPEKKKGLQELAQAKLDFLNAKTQRLMHERNTPEAHLTRHRQEIIAAEKAKERIDLQEGLHFAPTQETDWIPQSLQDRRQLAGFPPEGVAVSDLAKKWELRSDGLIQTVPAGRYQKEVGPGWDLNLWLDKVGADTTVYSPMPRAEQTVPHLGFDHLVDELRNATDAASGLPKDLLLNPAALSKVTVPQAIEHVAKINAWRAAQQAEADLVKANNAATVLHKDYPEKGMKWVELRKNQDLPEGYTVQAATIGTDKAPKLGFAVFRPDGTRVSVAYGPTEAKAISNYHQTAFGIDADKRTAQLQDALKYEGDTMQHCVGRHCDDVASGATRIFSLRDTKTGRPHVTIETTPSGSNSIRSLKEGSPEDYQITQIKGLKNLKPADEYLPYVQDFVKSGRWSAVGDLQNTGLVRYSNEYIDPATLKPLQDEAANYMQKHPAFAAHRKAAAKWVADDTQVGSPEYYDVEKAAGVPLHSTMPYTYREQLHTLTRPEEFANHEGDFSSTLTGALERYKKLKELYGPLPDVPEGFSRGGSVYSPARVDEIVTQHRNSEYDPARVDALVAQLKEEMYG